ncbi:MAG: polysaccharide biosynthesis protein [Ruminococcaceae bacterium]|nr:polysaccharide biosynthesis protein [Oscillospiraceae bacterium]
MSKKQSVAYGALILSVSGFLVKLVGAIFKIPLTNLVGAAAMSYFSSAYSIYVFLLSIATSGLPTGIATMVSSSLALERYKDISKIMKIASVIFVTLGTVLAVLGFIFAMPLAEGMNSREAYWSVAAIMPAIICISVVSVFKGFFQGYRNMTPTALSNLIEAIVKLLAGYGIALILHNLGYPSEIVVGGAVLGVSVSTFAAMIFMVCRYVFRSKNYRISISGFLNDTQTPTKKLTKDFLIISFPLIISSVTANLMSLVDAFVVMNRLKTYLDVEHAKLLWGSYGNMALTIFNLPSFLITAIGISLIPAISAAYAKKDKLQIEKTAGEALKYSSILAFGSAFGLNAVSEPVLNLFFPADPAGVQAATPLLQLISFALIAVGLTNITSAILQSVGKSYLPVISVAVGAGIKTLSTLILVSVPAVNVNGAPIATNIAYPVMLIMNIIFVYKNLGFLPKWIDVFVKPLVAGAVCWVAAKGFMFVFDLILPQKIALFPAIICAILVYFVFLIIVKLVSFNEIRSFLSKKRKNA